MNILLPYSSIKKRLTTDTTVEEFQRFLSLCGPSIERIEKIGNDYVMDIEVTTNRIDMACVAGIVQEANAILPLFDKKVSVSENLLTDYSLSQLNFPKEDLLHVINDFSLSPRITAVVFENIILQESSEEIRTFLEKVGVRPINNVVDISNYLMYLFGQPVHIFDYDKIGGGIIKLRKSKKGEKIELLDEKTYTLPGNDIVIEDGNGKLIDLCGIMGGKVSEVDEHTKRIVLFVPSYSKKYIRKTSMLTAARSTASSYYEKGIDTARVEPTFTYGVKLLTEHAQAHMSSRLVDVHEGLYTPRSISVTAQYIIDTIGESVDEHVVENILSSLGFGVTKSGKSIQVTVPFWRQFDVFEPHDIVEEVARIYGYHTINEVMSPFSLVRDEKIREFEESYRAETAVKTYLCNTGFIEMYNYSMESLEMLGYFSSDPKCHLRISNPISEDLVYMRQSIIPSLYKNMLDNTQFEHLSLFEIANIYIPRAADLPNEVRTLGILVQDSLSSLKMTLQNCVTQLNTSIEYKKGSLDYATNECIELYSNGTFVGYAGRLLPALEQRIGKKLVFAELKWDALVTRTRAKQTLLKKKPQYVIEDITYTYKAGLEWFELTSNVQKKFSEIQRIEYRDEYKDNITMRLYTLPEKGQSIVKKCVEYMRNELGIVVKAK
ncbi:MAG: phenylalanine--tRNA ligase subunit beta [Candidatus Roizmanbacteria bacterium]|nr:phenylalanine--tRNA ligase subunit beta [Candidatus Roizmanbacteria bacterium]